MKAKQLEECGKVYLLEMGHCQIHPSHGAFQKALKKLKIKIEQILVCHHSFFKNTTKRRYNYTQVCKKVGIKEQFPLEFGVTRWTDGVRCIARVREQIPAMKEYIKELPNTDKSVVTGEVFKVLHDFYADENIEENIVRLHFAEYLASKHVPFNAKLQADKPIAPFLCYSTRKLFQNILNSVSKDTLPTNYTDIAKYKVKEKIEKWRKTTPEFGATCDDLLKQLPEEKRNHLILEFKTAITEDLLSMQNMMSFNEVLIEELSSFEPDSRKRSKTNERMNKIAKKSNRFTESELLMLDDEIKEYTNLNSVPTFTGIDRLDEHYAKVWVLMEDKMGSKPENFIRLTKLVLSLSHGQATVERSFR